MNEQTCRCEGCEPAEVEETTLFDYAKCRLPTPMRWAEDVCASWRSRPVNTPEGRLAANVIEAAADLCCACPAEILADQALILWVWLDIQIAPLYGR